MTVSAYDMQKWAEAGFWLLALVWIAWLIAEMLRDRSSQTEMNVDRPDSAYLTDLDLDAIGDGEQRRIRTTGGDTLRLEGEPVEEGDGEEGEQ
ncbi:hypothetical protein [Halomicrobium mukohataei]|uniref:Uncharacterized protein n=1 Tax=Halomicrobium mukohataei (strain ATCC 700874 / DSM 12286 / JCM 9738 / NCIMB 13541) TaxID=485914 RepID=C7NYF8_HALMD|nr:hypothetical protein [Halomicrobium mukohataei]ACV46619.1 hypothetical protein Hmuk_0485 [Halomicrobium mukohataei DSM 12286]